MAEAHQPETGYADVNGAQLYYEAAGSGRPLVLIHGRGVNCRMWDEQFSVFAQYYRVVRYDLRGHGRSDQPGGFYSYSHDLYGLLQLLGIQRAALMGLSLGGRVAIDFTLEHPEMVEALILVGAGLSGFKWSDDPRWAEVEAAVKAGDIARAVELDARIGVDGPNRAPDQVKASVRERVKAMVAETYARPQPAEPPKEVGLDPPALKRLREIQVPTLVIVGDQDSLDMLVIADILQKHVAQATTHIIPGAGHMVTMEEPEEVNGVAQRFLQQV